MEEAARKALRELLLLQADDALILGQRASEWCGRAPILEEDIAFANLALDEIGHAGLFYGLIAELDHEDPDTYPDRLIYWRSADDYRCAQLVELPNGDWAFTMLRQYLYDAAEQIWLKNMASSAYAPLAEIAEQMSREELYHHRHTRAWVQRLGLGTEESHDRMQQALDSAWPYTAQLFEHPIQGILLENQLRLSDPQGLLAGWDGMVRPFLKECNLLIPEAPRRLLRRSEHTPHLARLLADLQALPRQDPEAKW